MLIINRTENNYEFEHLKVYLGDKLIYGEQGEDTPLPPPPTPPITSDTLAFEFTGNSLTYRMNMRHEDILSEYCYYATETPFSKKLSDITSKEILDIYQMFYYEKITRLTSMFNTSKIADMGSMFNNCTELESVCEFDTTNATNMSFMFTACPKLKKAPALNIENANLDNMFNGCKLLADITFIGNPQSTTKYNMAFYNVAKNGVFKYDDRYDYSAIIAHLNKDGRQWQIVPITV